MSTPERRRYSGLDGLRGAAAVVVVISHCVAIFPAMDQGPHKPYVGYFKWLVDSPVHILWGGNAAVVTFFVLSGFVLTKSVKGQSFDSWSAYYISRFIRLYIPVWASLLIAFMLHSLTSASIATDPGYFVRSHTGILDIHMLLHDALIVLGSSGVNGPLWSLRWEVYFSVLLPLYIWVDRKLVLFGPAVSLIPVVIVAVSYVVGFPAVSWLPMFAIGTFMAHRTLLLDNYAMCIKLCRYPRLGWICVIAACILMLSSEFTLGVWGGPLAALCQALVVVGAALAIFLSIHFPPATDFFTARPLQVLGMISFSLYLVHERLVIMIASHIGVEVRWLVPIVAIPTSMALAGVFYLLIERPSQALSRRARRAWVDRRRPRSFEPPS